MGLFDKFFGKGKETTVSKDLIIEAGACPNCWGHQEYDGQFKEFLVDQTKSNINHDQLNQKSFISQFVETHVSGIKLKNQDGKLHCPKCNAKF